MLKINGQTFMNIQEAVQWLLDNNALPFQCTANYIANAEIGMGTIVNPSPAKVRIGSLIFFADSKVSTVVGITENGFIVGDQYNDLVDDVVYVSNVEVSGAGYLLVTLSNGEVINAGLIKQISNFSINASQHLIATYNSGSSEDLGAIFNGNVNISGNLTADSIIENMSGYSFAKYGTNFTAIYAGIVKNGNKLTFVLFGSYTKEVGTNFETIASFSVPHAVYNKLFPYTIGGLTTALESKKLSVSLNSSRDTQVDVTLEITKNQYLDEMDITLLSLPNMTDNATYLVRIEQTFLLSENLAS